MGGRHGESESAAPPLEHRLPAARRRAPAAAAPRHAPVAQRALLARVGDLRFLAGGPTERVASALVAVDALAERVERVAIFRAVVRQTDDPVVASQRDHRLCALVQYRRRRLEQANRVLRHIRGEKSDLQQTISPTFYLLLSGCTRDCRDRRVCCHSSCASPGDPSCTASGTRPRRSRADGAPSNWRESLRRASVPIASDRSARK